MILKRKPMNLKLPMKMIGSKPDFDEKVTLLYHVLYELKCQDFLLQLMF